MSNLKRGFQFLGQYARLFAAAAGLRWPVLLSLASGLVMALVALIPILLSRAFLMGGFAGRLVIGFFGALLLLACLACGWAWSEMVPNALVRTLERKPDPEALLQQIKTTLRRLPDLYGLLITLPVVEAVDAPLASQSQWVKNGLIGGGATSVWGRGSYLVLPVMAIEARNLHESLVRTAQLVRENRPQVDPGVVGARLAAVLVGLVIAVIGFGASLWIYRAMGSHLIDMGVAVVLYGLFVSAAGSLATGAINVYETCLYLWAVAAEREENSRSGDNSIPAAPPAPLAAVLTGMASIPAPYFSE